MIFKARPESAKFSSGIRQFNEIHIICKNEMYNAVDRSLGTWAKLICLIKSVLLQSKEFFIQFQTGRVVHHDKWQLAGRERQQTTQSRENTGSRPS